MNWLGLVLILFSTSYLLYSLIYRKRVTIYNKNEKIKIGKEEEYLELQLLFSLVNSMWMITVGLLIIMYNIKSIAIVLLPLIFHFVNLLLKLVSKKKGYIIEY